MHRRSAVSLPLRVEVVIQDDSLRLDIFVIFALLLGSSSRPRTHPRRHPPTPPAYRCRRRFTPALPRMPAGLDLELERYLGASLATGTQSNLRTALRHFEAFTAEQPAREPLQHPRWGGDLEATLHNELTFMLFMVWLVKDGKRLAGTAINYCSLVRNHVAAVSGFPLSSSTPRWKKLVRAVRKLHHRERRECRPLRIAHLRRAWIGAMRLPTTTAVNRWAAVAAGVHLIARPGELARLRRSDLTWGSEPVPHAIIRLKPLKKGPEQQPVPMLIARGDGGGGDAYAALARLEAIDPVPPSAQASTPLFRDARGRTPSGATFTRWVQEVARAAGEGRDVRRFVARSLRIGGATELHAMGANQLTIMLLGRWSSDVSRLYTRVSRGQVLDLSARMGRASDDPALEQLFHDFVQTARR